MTTNITTGDLAAIMDVLREVIADADGCSLEEAATMREALFAVIAKAKEAQGAMETRLREQLEEAKEPRRVGNRVYVMRNDYADTWHHEDIVKALARAVSRADQNGVVSTADEAALDAAWAVYESFVSPSIKPKVNKLKQYLGPEGPQMRSRTLRGRKLDVVIIDQEDDDGDA